MKISTLTTAVALALGVATYAPVDAGEMDKDQMDRSAGQVLDDTTIAGKLKAKLATDELTDAVDIDVEVDKDHVQLNGFVDSQAQKDRAGEIAANIKGVNNVTNNLEINDGQRQAGEYVDDKMLVARAKAALADDPTAKALEIDVEANRGVISLGGHVDSEAERMAAERAVAQVDGVVRVINNLDIS